MNITQRIGDTVTHRIPLRWNNAPFVPGDEWALVFTVKDDPDTQEDSSARFQKRSGAGISVSSSVASVDVLRIDTAGGTFTPEGGGDPVTVTEVPPGTYHWDIKARQIAEPNETRTVASGTLVLAQVVTREVDPSVPIFSSQPPGFIGSNILPSTTPPTRYDVIWFDPSDGTISVWDADNEVWVQQGIYIETVPDGAFLDDAGDAYADENGDYYSDV